MGKVEGGRKKREVEVQAVSRFPARCARAIAMIKRGIEYVKQTEAISTTQSEKQWWQD